ncbi:hypothetical protein QE152_g37343 [Popillia japonica]|uniref:HTH psq-type domain-containing protein n=1 Tax=Popillia japonica TaxID=7064 RepID=A0AAW1IAG9_POPJA
MGVPKAAKQFNVPQPTLERRFRAFRENPNMTAAAASTKSLGALKTRNCCLHLTNEVSITWFNRGRASSRNIVDATSLLSAQQDAELLETLRPRGKVDSTEMPGPSHQAIEVLQTPSPSHQDGNLQTLTHIQFAFAVTPEDNSPVPKSTVTKRLSKN